LDAAEETVDAKLKRAQRFGLPLSNEQLKLKRAERVSGAIHRMQFLRKLTLVCFPSQQQQQQQQQLAIYFQMPKSLLPRNKFGQVSNKSSSIGVVEKASLDVLEKRAKRFGLCSEEAEVHFCFVIHKVLAHKTL
uniref:Rubis-subs-bind domain-containing protein n=1 Tax=Gongylonema pulchrum TaxID=637853 RepID=A0A183D599_9BILA